MAEVDPHNGEPFKGFFSKLPVPNFSARNTHIDAFTPCRIDRSGSYARDGVVVMQWMALC